MRRFPFFLFLLAMLPGGCGERPQARPTVIYGNLLLTLEREPVPFGEVRAVLFLEKDVEEKLAYETRRIEALKVAAEERITEMRANYRQWGVTRAMSPAERAERIPPEEAERVALYEKERPAMKKLLANAENDFDYKTLLQAPHQPVAVDRQGVFQFPMPPEGRVALFLQTQGTGEYSKKVFTLMRWTNGEVLKTGRMTLTEKDHCYYQYVRWWLKRR